MNPLVSVLLPVYNGEAYVREAIESVLNQHYRNFEFIIVDNASTDQTASIIDDYKGDQRIRIIRNERTISRLENFVKAFAAASEESSWYKFIGDDDRLLPDCLEEMVGAAVKYNNLGFVTSYYYNGPTLVTGLIPREEELISGPVLLHHMLVEPAARKTIFSPTAMLLSARVYKEMGGFRTDLLHADAELFYRILNRYDLAYVHKPLMAIGYHSASGQAISTVQGHTFTEAYLIRYRNLEKYDNIQLNIFERERVKFNLVLDSTGFMLARAARGDVKTALKHLRVIPPAALYHLIPAVIYFSGLAVKKLLKGESFRLFGGEDS